MQVWNIEHHSSRFFLTLTYIISNLGKGDLNNGLSIYVFDKQKNQEYLKTLEYTNQKLKAVKSKISIELENQASIIMNLIFCGFARTLQKKNQYSLQKFLFQ